MTLTQTQAAALRGISSRRLRQLESESENPPPRNEKGKYPIAEFGEWLKKIYSGAQHDYERERARLTHHQANEKALQVSILEGELVPLDQITNHWVSLSSNMRAKLLSLPTKVAQITLANTNLKNLEAAIRVLVYEALNEIATDGIPDESIKNGRINNKAGANTAATNNS